MAISKLNFNSLNVTPTASKGIGFDSGADDLEANFSGGSMVFISKFTSDGSDDTATFASGIDSTYKEYVFVFNDIHPQTDSVYLTVNFRDGSTAYDATKTTSAFTARHDEADSATSLAYTTGDDLAQATGVQYISGLCGNGNDECTSGILHLFNPSSTTFVKHFIVESNVYDRNNRSVVFYVGGYCNVTAAIDGAQFKMSSGQIQGGTITLYGIT